MSVTYPIIINKSNFAGGSSFRYSFVKANNSFSIIHPTSSGTIPLNLTIPDGGYNVSDLNNYLFWYLVSQGYYISNNSTGEQTVYCKFVVNPSTYQVQFISYTVPTALPSGFTAGPQLTFPSTSKGPQLSIASPAFGKVIGFATGTFPSSQPSTITTRLLRYRKDRDAEERNSDATQLRLYELLAQEAGEEEQASRLANMARRIGSKILDPSEPSEAIGSIDPIVAAIKGKYLDKLIKEFRALPSSSLSPALQNIQRNLSHATFRSKLNERMAEMKAKNASAIEFSLAFLDKMAAGDPEAKGEFMKVVQQCIKDAARLRQYRHARDDEETNNEATQFALYDSLAKEATEAAQAQRLANMARHIWKHLAAADPSVAKAAAESSATLGTAKQLEGVMGEVPEYAEQSSDVPVSSEVNVTSTDNTLWLPSRHRVNVGSQVKQ
ncbi:hypothetical protein PInf_011930 [Phytophthora infestans]|nr:hypothetical protein PInf_011930 [Phytophthora infestans]